MLTSVPLTELKDWLKIELTASRGQTAIIAGHFALHSSGGPVHEYVDDSDDATDSVRDFATFTRTTWEAACAAVASSSQLAWLVAVVDDVTQLQPQLIDRTKQERLAVELTRRYYFGTSTLPAYHKRILSKYDLPDSCVLKNNESQWMFSERKLRVDFVSRVKAGLPGANHDFVKVTADNNAITMFDSEFGALNLVQSGHANCSGGYIQLMTELSERGAKTIIALVPMRCMSPTVSGVLVAQRMHLFHDCTVVNVAIPSEGTSACAYVHRHSL